MLPAPPGVATLLSRIPGHLRLPSARAACGLLNPQGVAEAEEEFAPSALGNRMILAPELPNS